MKTLNKQQVKAVTKAINDFYMGENPPPSNVFIPPATVGLYSEDGEKFDKGVYQAAVRIESNWTNNTVKSHKINIKFKLTAYGKVDRRSLTYL